jgi:hypothetical protein
VHRTGNPANLALQLHQSAKNRNMAHHQTIKQNSYFKLTERLNRFPQILNDLADRGILMAIERGTLHNLVFDEQVFLSHRAMAAVLGVILKLPPVKQVMASNQFKSKYLEGLIRRHNIE